jgi:hypothetical protein
VGRRRRNEDYLACSDMLSTGELEAIPSFFFFLFDGYSSTRLLSFVYVGFLHFELISHFQFLELDFYYPWMLFEQSLEVTFG